MQITPPSSPRPRRGWAHRLSTILFIASLLFAGAAIYLYLNQDDSPDGPVVPTPEAGRNEYASVIEALRAQDLEVDAGRYSVEADQLEQPGQTINVGDYELFVFIYPDGDSGQAVAAREADAEDLDPETVRITSREAERPINEGQEVHVYQRSNIVAILVGGDDETQAAVEEAINSLP